MKSIAAINAYGLMKDAEQNPLVQAFIDTVREQIDDVTLEVCHSRSLAHHAPWLARRLCEPLDLVYACGSTLMEIANEVIRERGERRTHVVYWGTHIHEGAGLINPHSQDDWTYGVELSMPIYSNFRQFRLLKILFPRLKNVYSVFALEGAFTRGRVLENYQTALKSQGKGCWIEANSSSGGHQQLGKLAETLDIQLFEHPCQDGEDVAEAVSRIPAEPHHRLDESQSVVVACADCFHARDAVESLIVTTHKRKLPFVGQGICGFWEDFGPLLLIENSFARAAKFAGSLAVDLLSGRLPAAHLVKRDFFQLRFNTRYAARAGFSLCPRKRDRVRRQLPLILTEEHECLELPGNFPDTHE